MTDDRGEGFLGRWSRLKRERAADEDRRDRPEHEGEAADTEMVPAPAADASSDERAEGDSEPLDLPPIDSLDKDSDFTVFMKEGVPEELRRQALRKLWLTDPVLANLDGLLEYGEDFNEPWRAGGVVKTLYRVGKGMPGVFEAIAEEPALDSEEDLSGTADPEEMRTTHQRAEATGSGEANDADSGAQQDEPPGDGSTDEPVPPKSVTDA